MSAATAASVEVIRAGYSESYKRLVLTLLALAYTFNYIDRTIIYILGQAIKVDLKLTDAQLGLLGGFSFAILYTVVGVPIARIAERRSRVSIISAALFLWSGFTSLCGIAGSFIQLALCRVGVGFGEAGLTPPAHSLISDYFAPKQRSSALSLFAFGIPIGGMLGAAVGGWLAKNFGWRVAFMIVGAPGIIMAALIQLLIREPARGHSEIAEDPLTRLERAPLPSFSLAGEMTEIRSLIRRLFLNWPLANLILGMTLMTFAMAGAGQFAAPYFVRTFNLDYATVGLIVGLVGGFSNGVGTLLGGFITDWAGKRREVWYALVPAIGVAISAPIYIVGYTLNDWKAAALVLLLPGMFAFTFLGPIFAVIQNAVGPHQRATATALVFFVGNIVGLGAGPPFIGWMIDHLAQFHFAHPGPLGFLPSITSAFSSSAYDAVKFAVACPGGMAPKDAVQAAVQTCHGALTVATRQGMIAAYLFSLWGALHFFLASLRFKNRL